MTLLDTIVAAKRDGDPQRLLDAVPYSKFLGLHAAISTASPGFAGVRSNAEGVAEVSSGLVTTMRFADHLVGNPALPALHGGTLGALLESAAIFELLWRAETVVLPKTITLTVAYLRSGASVDTHARGIVTRHGRRVANVRVEAWQGDRAAPVATANAIFLVMREEPAAGAS